MSIYILIRKEKWIWKKFEGCRNKISATEVLHGTIKVCYSYLFIVLCKNNITTNYVTHCTRLDIIEIAADEVLNFFSGFPCVIVNMFLWVSPTNILLTLRRESLAKKHAIFFHNIIWNRHCFVILNKSY